jgi:DNA primase
VQKHGADKLLEVLSTALDIFEFGLREWAADAGQLSGREKSERVEQFMPLLSAVTDPVVRNEAGQRIADAFRLEFETVWSRVRSKASAPQKAERQFSAPQNSAEKFVLMAAIQGRLTPEQVGRVRVEFFDDPACKTLFSIIKNDLERGQAIDFTEVATHLRGEAELTLLSELSLSDDIDERISERFDQSLLPLERSYLQRRNHQLSRDISEAERSGDAGRADELFAEQRELTRMLHSLK